MSPFFSSTSRSAGSKGIARFESQREAPILTFPQWEEGTLFAVCGGLMGTRARGGRRTGPAGRLR